MVMNAKQSVIISLLVLVFVSGCTTVALKESKKELVVQTKMSKSIFLEPVDRRVVYVEVRNTSGDARLEIGGFVLGQMQARGITVTNTLSQANTRLQINVLRMERDQKTAADNPSDVGAAGYVIGSVLGSSAGSRYSEEESLGSLLGGTLGVLIETKIAAATKDVTYTLVTDLQLSEKVDGEWKKHTAEVISTANQVNLELENALPEMSHSLAASLAGLL